MKLTEEQIRRVIREEIDKRYTVFYDQDLIKGLERKDGEQLQEFWNFVGQGLVRAGPALWRGATWLGRSMFGTKKAAVTTIGLTGTGIAVDKGMEISDALSDFDPMEDLTAIVDPDSPEAQNQRKVSIAFDEDDVGWETWESKIDGEDADTDLSWVELEGATRAGIRADKIWDLRDQWTDDAQEEEMINEFLDAPTILDMCQTSFIYREKNGEDLLEAFKDELGDDQIKRVERAIQQKPLLIADVNGKKERIFDFSDYQGLLQRGTASGQAAVAASEAERQRLAEGDPDVKALQAALGTRQSGILNLNDGDALLNDLEFKYVERDGMPTKLEIAKDLKKRFGSIPDMVYPPVYPEGHNYAGQPHPRAGMGEDGTPKDGVGGTRSFERLGYPQIRGNYWKVLADVVRDWNRQAVTESLESALDIIITKNIRVKRESKPIKKINEAINLDISRFEMEDSGRSSTRRSSSRSTPRSSNRRRGSQTVKQLQAIIGAPSCNNPDGCDGIWGSNTTNAFAAFAVANLPPGWQWENRISMITRDWKGDGAGLATRYSRQMGGPSFAPTDSGALSFARWLSSGDWRSGAAAARIEVEPEDTGVVGTTSTGGRERTTSRTTSSVVYVSPRNALNDSQKTDVARAVQEWSRGSGTVRLRLKEIKNDSGERNINIEASPSNLFPMGFLGLGTGRDELRERLKNLRLPDGDIRIDIEIT